MNFISVFIIHIQTNKDLFSNISVASGKRHRILSKKNKFWVKVIEQKYIGTSP